MASAAHINGMRTRRILQTFALAAALTLGLMAPSFNGLSLLALVILGGIVYSERDSLAAFIDGGARAEEPVAEDSTAA